MNRIYFGFSFGGLTKNFILLLLIISLVQFEAASAAPVTLKECYAAALARSEDLASNVELINQAEEKLAQYRGAMFPSITGTATYLVQPAPSNSTANTFFPANQTTVRITAIQPLFRGLREFAALRQGKDLVESASLNKEQAAIQLYQDLVQAFYQVIGFEADLANLQDERGLYDKQLEQLHKFRRVGRSREAELLTLQSKVASVDAGIEATAGQKDAARDLLAFLTGFDPKVGLKDETEFPRQSLALEEYLDTIEARPDIRSLKKNLESSEEAVRIARGAHFPSLDLQGDYFFARAGALATVPWGVQLSLSLPIFQGGIVQSMVRESASVQKQNDLALTKARRLARQQVESLFHLTMADQAQVSKLNRAVILAEQTYQSQNKDYRLGLVTQIEVLEALKTYEENQRVLDRAKLQTKSDYLRLVAASGRK